MRLYPCGDWLCLNRANNKNFEDWDVYKHKIILEFWLYLSVEYNLNKSTLKRAINGNKTRSNK